jgi:hypothetical protein
MLHASIHHVCWMMLRIGEAHRPTCSAAPRGATAPGAAGALHYSGSGQAHVVSTARPGAVSRAHRVLLCSGRPHPCMDKAILLYASPR